MLNSEYQEYVYALKDVQDNFAKLKKSLRALEKVAVIDLCLSKSNRVSLAYLELIGNTIIYKLWNKNHLVEPD